MVFVKRISLLLSAFFAIIDEMLQLSLMYNLFPTILLMLLKKLKALSNNYTPLSAVKKAKSFVKQTIHP